MNRKLSAFAILLLLATHSACSKKATTATTSGGGGAEASIEGSWTVCQAIDLGGGTFKDIRFTVVISGTSFSLLQQLHSSNDTTCSGYAIVSTTRAGLITSGSGTPAVEGAVAIDIQTLVSTVAAQHSDGLGMAGGCSGEDSPALNTEYAITNTECGYISPNTEYSLAKVTTTSNPDALSFGIQTGGSDDGSTVDKRHQGIDNAKVFVKVE